MHHEVRAICFLEYARDYLIHIYLFEIIVYKGELIQAFSYPESVLETAVHLNVLSAKIQRGTPNDTLPT
ncbi:hypothetical protein O997_01625 [Anaplasma phagocytophilum str. MRK]|nr:hypothetical protein O997_01625 [Anaplasma phagocytophilum str. MRK]